MNTIKLFCLPYAGGSANVYLQWKKHLHPSIQLIPIELKGRGRRFSEPFYDHLLDDAVLDIVNSIKAELDGSQYAIFGHSMGSVLTFETSYRLIEETKQEPVHLFFSGRYPPHIKKKREHLHVLPDDRFIQKIYELGGTSEEVLENKELLELFVPLLKADYRILELYEYQEKQQPLDVNFTLFHGRQDNHVTSFDMIEWKEHTSKEIKLYEFDGGHFFIHDYTQDILQIINQTLITSSVGRLY